MRIAHAWLQKHPTPAASDGAFHWYPEIDPALSAQLAADAGDAVTLWLTPDRVIVAHRFSAIAPADHRSYQGLAVALADGADTASLLAALTLPLAAPCAVQGTAHPACAVQGTAHPGCAVQGTAHPGCAVQGTAHPGCAVQGTAAMWRGGRVQVLALADAARIEGWLPSEIRTRPRRILIGEGEDELGTLGPVARWLAGAIGSRGAARVRAQRAWRTVQELARVEGREVAAQVAELAALEGAWATAAGVRAYLEAAGIVLEPRLHVAGDGRDQWARALHGWGRGWVSGTRTAEIAAVLARRGVADRLADAPARRWQRILRREALVPAARAEVLEREALARLPALEDGDG